MAEIHHFMVMFTFHRFPHSLHKTNVVIGSSELRVWSCKHNIIQHLTTVTRTVIEASTYTEKYINSIVIIIKNKHKHNVRAGRLAVGGSSPPELGKAITFQAIAKFLEQKTAARSEKILFIKWKKWNSFHPARWSARNQFFANNYSVWFVN